MATNSSIFLTEETTQPVRIRQLFQHLELFSEGEPPRHALFVLGRPNLADALSEPGAGDQLLVIDPPARATERFRLEGQVAALYTGPTPQEPALPLVQTQAGGVAHIRVGEHFLDIHSQQHHTVVHLPALGILCGGDFGSDVIPPILAPGSTGDDELATLRLLARLVKGHRLQIYVPRTGDLGTDKFQVMQRLAADVAYLHGLRRVVPAAVSRGEDPGAIQALAATLLPTSWQTPQGQQVHARNVDNFLS
ncbi:MAG: hypothetical protein KatS3mg050_2085 [Litorilinea sp.]|nr:MAG: hypothetical protein KatS3mg050_2085 [Litorilinea sp.]